MRSIHHLGRFRPDHVETKKRNGLHTFPQTRRALRRLRLWRDPLSIVASLSAALFINQAFIKEKQLPAQPKRQVDNPDTKTEPSPASPSTSASHCALIIEGKSYCNISRLIENSSHCKYEILFCSMAFQLLCSTKPNICCQKQSVWMGMTCSDKVNGEVNCPMRRWTGI